jgi:hypothetical protein
MFEILRPLNLNSRVETIDNPPPRISVPIISIPGLTATRSNYHGN